MKKLSVSDVSELAGKSARHIRNLCREGKLPCQKVKISTGEKYFIYVDTEEFKELIQASDVLHGEEENNTYEGTLGTSEEGTLADERGSWQLVVNSMTSKIESLAREAGKAELLTDNLMTSEQNVKFYQDEYFKIRQELQEQRDLNSKLEKENNSLHERIKLLESQREEIAQTFWGKRLLDKLSKK